MLLQRTAPMLHVPLGGADSIQRVVARVTAGLAASAHPPAPGELEHLALALSEVMLTVIGTCGEQDPASASVELWLQPCLAVVTIRFSGPRLPDWLLANWDRGREPAVLTPPTDSGWGWPLVRGELDAIQHQRVPGGQLLLLEKRLRPSPTPPGRRRI